MFASGQSIWLSGGDILVLNSATLIQYLVKAHLLHNLRVRRRGAARRHLRLLSTGGGPPVILALWASVGAHGH